MRPCSSSGFRLLTDPGSPARAGELSTAHGVVPTPVFLPVASQASVKSLSPEDVRRMGVSMLLANTYHLYLRPGVEVIRKLGGLHRFMAWEGAILTDSGGFQIFSLARLCQVTDEGVAFRSHIDGSEHFITPEQAVEYQEALGADVIMVLDECPPHDAPLEKIRQAMERTHRWAERGQKAHRRPGQSLFAIVQGGLSPELRKESARFLTSMGFAGYGIGGLSLGEPKETTWAMVEETTAYLPAEKPRYLMGVGSPEDIVEGVARGIDLFDSALPTRVARNGSLFTARGRHNIGNSVYRTQEAPFDTECPCSTCRTFSAAYLHHLFSRRELLFYGLATIHNLTFLQRLIERIRESILKGDFDAFRQDFLAGYQPTEEGVRLEQKEKWLKTRRSAEEQ